MELESHFTCVAPDVIRIAGTRVGIETIISDYEEGASPEEMVMRYPTVSLDQVHAAITYYLSLLQKSFSPFDTSGRTDFCICNVLNFRSW